MLVFFISIDNFVWKKHLNQTTICIILLMLIYHVMIKYDDVYFQESNIIEE